MALDAPPDEAGLSRFVRVSNGPFIGREALPVDGALEPSTVSRSREARG
jgi:glycine cleavage system aminomethyltransferase T